MSRFSRQARRAALQEPPDVRLRLDVDVLAETAAGIVMGLQQHPYGQRHARAVTVLVRPGFSLVAAAEELRVLASELETS